MPDKPQRLVTLGAVEHEPRRPHTLVPASDFLLYELDVLHELGDRVEAKQRQKPRIERCRLRAASRQRQLEQANRFRGERVHQSRDPSNGAHANALDDRVIHAGQDPQAVADQRLDP